MGSADEKTETLKKQQDRYDSAVMQFLDQEIAASSKTAAGSKAQADDVDVIVQKLLKESMNTPETAAATQETGGEELDRLFSRIFKENKPALQTEPALSRPAVDSLLAETLKEIGVVDRQSVDIRQVDSTPRQEVAAASPAQSTSRAPAAAVAAGVHAAPQPRMMQTSEVRGTRESVAAVPEPAEVQETMVFAPAPPKRFWNTRVALICGAFLCLLAGGGLVLLKNSGNPAPAKADQPSQPTSAAVPPKVESPTVPSPVPASTTAANTAPVRPNKALNTPAPASAAGNNAAANTGAQPKEGKPAAAAQPTAPPVVNPPITATVVTDAVEKPASTTAAPAGNPVVTPPPRAADPTPPPALQPQPVPATPLAPLIPNASANLEDATTAKRPAFQPPVQPPNLPRVTVPASVASRVSPAYPEIARKSRITGTVVVEVLIDNTGKVTKATAVSGPSILYAESVNAVRRWQFRPATIDGVAVPSSNQVSIVFK